MSSVFWLPCEDELECCICKDVFTAPVTLPCGHNFCKSCISRTWDTSVQLCCPICKETFDRKPSLRVNTAISEMTARFRQSVRKPFASRKPEQPAPESKPRDVPCDLCKDAAVKSCLVCLSSFCPRHLEPHQTLAGLRRHELIEPVENLETRMCRKHDKPLELFCRTDQTCVCSLCPNLDHKSHMFVPLRDEFSRKKAALRKTEAGLQQKIQTRKLKIQELRESAELSREAADGKLTEAVRIFTDLMAFLERGLDEVTKTIEDKRRTAEDEAEGFIRELEQEISELTERAAEAEQLSRSEDPLHLLQRASTLSSHVPTKDWTGVSVRQPLYEEMVRKSVVRAVEELDETFRTEKKNLLEEELKRVQQFAVDVTLDPSTASPWLVLSHDGKRAHLGDMKKSLPDKPERFHAGGGVLGRQGISSGRFYYEVHVKGKTKWDVGVVKESINRKEKLSKSPEDDYWVLSLRRGNELRARGGLEVKLSPTWLPQRVGVFVDYEEGVVSFYDVDAADVIYSFTGCCFTKTLYPFFNPTSTPLTIAPVNQNH